MLSIEQCQRILNEAAPPGVEYTREEAATLRDTLYTIALHHLRVLQGSRPTPTQPDHEANVYHLRPRLDGGTT